MDGNIDFECMGNGVIRGIASVNDNYYGDSIYRVECCTMVPGKFSVPVGEWKTVINCKDCATTQHEVQIGTITTQSTTTSESYAKSLGHSIALGYTFKVDLGIPTSSETSITYTLSKSETKTTAIALEDSIAQWQFTTKTVTCNKQYLFQWTHSAYDYTNSVDVTMLSLEFLCSDNEYPKCPLGWCGNDDCSVCKSGYSGNN